MGDLILQNINFGYNLILLPNAIVQHQSMQNTSDHCIIHSWGSLVIYTLHIINICINQFLLLLYSLLTGIRVTLGMSRAMQTTSRVQAATVCWQVD